MSDTPKTVLIVNDDQGTQDALMDILKRGYRVLKVNSGEAALTTLSREHVDLLLIDVRLPGISGFELLRIVKENYALLEVSMISSVSEIETAVQAIKHWGLSLHHQGFRSRPAAFSRAQRQRTPDPEPASVDALGTSDRPERAGIRRLPQQSDPRRRRPGAQSRQAVGHSAHSRREWHGQGAARATHPSAVCRSRRTVHRGESRSDPAGTGRKHALRA